MLRWLCAMGLCLLTAACTTIETAVPAERVTLRAEPATVTAGDSVTLTLRNESAGAVGYNLCTSALQHSMGDHWMDVPSDRICTMELRTLATGQSARYRFGLPAGLAAGEYRFATGIERLDAGDRFTVSSNAVRVTPR